MMFSRFSDVRPDAFQSENLAHSMLTSQEQQQYLNNQDGTTRLDSFTHCLVSKCPNEVRRARTIFGLCLEKIIPFNNKEKTLLIQ